MFALPYLITSLIWVEIPLNKFPISCILYEIRSLDVLKTTTPQHHISLAKVRQPNLVVNLAVNLAVKLFPPTADISSTGVFHSPRNMTAGGAT
jgi:hypothetical protein